MAAGRQPMAAGHCATVLRPALFRYGSSLLPEALTRVLSPGMLLNTTRGTLLALLALFASCAFAQPDKPKTKVVLYKDRIAAQWDTVNCVKNIIKVNPLLFLRGEVPVYYERALSSRLSAELGMGITLRNYVNLTFAGDHADADDFGAGTKILNSPSAHLGFRYYLTDDLEPQGNYLQVEFAYLRYGKEITVKDSTGQFTGLTNLDERIFNDVRLYYGYQKLSSTSNWLFDFYAGIAMRSRHMIIVNEKIDTTVPFPRPVTYEIEEIDDLVPAFFLGVKIGLGW
jgi:hypothetical protein